MYFLISDLGQCLGFFCYSKVEMSYFLFRITAIMLNMSNFVLDNFNYIDKLDF